MDVIWTTDAAHNLVDICNHIAADSPDAAVRMDEIFHDVASRLAVFPHMGETGPFPGTRELIVRRQYRLVYEVDVRADTVWVLALIHGARDWPPKA